MNLKRVDDEVFIAVDPIVQLGAEEIAFLKEVASCAPRRRARICAHKTNEDPLHEMFIVIAGDSYIRPHRHFGKSESFHIVEGAVDVAVFDDGGALLDVVELGATGSGRRFFYRLAHSAFHTLLIRSDFVVLHEVTNGPFDRKQGSVAPFAPDESDQSAARAYMETLAARVAAFRKPS